MVPEKQSIAVGLGSALANIIRRMFVVGFILLSLLPAGHAVEPMAAASGASAASAGAINTLSAFDASGIQALFGPGKLPRMSHLDPLYENEGTRPSKQCRSSWNDLKRKKVVTRSVTPAQVEDLKSKVAAKGFNPQHAAKALASFLANQDRLPNQRYVSFVDFNQHSTAERMVIMDLQTLTVETYHVAAGKGSDRNSDGYADRFTNVSGTLTSSLGCAVANGRFHDSKGRRALLLHGIEESNDKTCKRDIFMHTAKYVGSKPGRSWGCPAVKPAEAEEIYRKLNGGGLICSYYDGKQVGGRAVKSKTKSKVQTKKTKKGVRYARRR